SYDEQPQSTNHFSDGYGAYSTDYDSANEIPTLTTLENQIGRYDVDSNLTDDVDQSDYLRRSVGISEFNNREEDGSEENSFYGQAESPLAAYLKSPLTELPSQTDSEKPSGFSANLDSFLAPPESQDHSDDVPSVLRDVSFAIDDDSYATRDDSNDRHVLSEPTNELSIRLRQMLAELKAEEEQSVDTEEPSTIQKQEIVLDAQEPEDDGQMASPSWLRDYAPSYPHQDQDRIRAASDDSRYASNEIAPYEDQSHEPIVSIDIDSTASLETPPELPSFDWNKGSLLLTEDDRQIASVQPEAVEEEDEIDEDPPSSTQSSSANPSPGSAKDDREESIEEYMQKLLQRVKQGQDGTETPAEDLTIKSGPRSRREFLNRATKPVETDNSTHEPPKSGEPVVEATKRLPPEQVDIDSLRELANSNARRAIARSEIKRANSTLLIKVAVTSFAIAAAALILLLNGFAMNPPFAGFIAALVIAILWGTDCYKHFKAIKNSKLAKPVTNTPTIADDKEVRTGNDAERGWRPSSV
ncbi:MAG: hypothetical protein MUC83_06730, partial [Pirellula sp.]|nr:hypothetical protein [Pirellula sp.]